MMHIKYHIMSLRKKKKYSSTFYQVQIETRRFKEKNMDVRSKGRLEKCNTDRIRICGVSSFCITRAYEESKEKDFLINQKTL